MPRRDPFLPANELKYQAYLHYSLFIHKEGKTCTVSSTAEENGAGEQIILNIEKPLAIMHQSKFGSNFSGIFEFSNL